MNQQSASLPDSASPATPESDNAPLTKAEFQKLLNQQLSLIERRAAALDLPGATVPQPVADAARVPGRNIRNGKIARLPKPERDMVCRMLRNNIPYAKIVAALQSRELKVTERNVSNWKTRGGYKEWCAEQERVLQLSLAQDKLTDYLRMNEAGQLPEVGLQVAATQLSLTLLQPDAARELAADPKKYSLIVDMLCRLSEQIEVLQKKRNIVTSIYGKRELLDEAFHNRREVEAIRHTYSAAKLGRSAYEPDVPHRNYIPAPTQEW